MTLYHCGSCLSRFDGDRQSQVCPHPKRPPQTQTTRLVEYLRTHPGASGLEIIHALNLPKYTSRISDARALGVNVVCIRREDGRRGYVIADRPVILSGEQLRLGVAS